MPPFSDKSDSPKTVLFVVYPNIVLLDLVGPLQVFTHARACAASPAAYETHVASYKGGQLETNTVVQIDSQALDDWLTPARLAQLDTLIIVGGDGVIPAMENAALVTQVTQLARHARRICSVCSGALLLAATGLLDGRRAVTHWEDCDMLRDRFPKVSVEVDPIFIKDGPIWTSAGITAGIDMALAIVREDLGSAAALDMARSLVTPMIRSAGQSQFSAQLTRQATDSEGRFEALHTWLDQNLNAKISVNDMAAKSGMSPRNFSRRYMQTIGKPPAKALEAIRVEAARELLISSALDMKTVAQRCGFPDPERMRRAFHRHLQTSPSSYRSQFQDT